jgi:hypothetical protein
MMLPTTSAVAIQKPSVRAPGPGTASVPFNRPPGLR